MSDSPSKAKDVKTKARVADQSPLSAQALKRAKNQEDEKKRWHATFNYMLEHIKHDPQIFQREEMKYLREFVNHIESRHDIYPCNPDDVTPCPFYAPTFPIHWQKTSFHNWFQTQFIVKLHLTYVTNCDICKRFCICK